jgi:hypothetical protein
MKTIDFQVFTTLMDEVHQKAFGETLSHLPYSKAKMLSLLIYDETGEMLSYKSLGNYVSAILQRDSAQINPTISTLGILTNYLHGSDSNIIRGKSWLKRCAVWYAYRSKVVCEAGLNAAGS